MSWSFPVPVPPPPSAFRGLFRTDDDARAVYAEAAGIARIAPLAVAVPSDPDDVTALVHWARDTGTALIPRGSGSGMSGGAVGPGVVVDLSRLATAEPVDTAHRSIRVGPGVVRVQVDRLAGQRGLRFPVDPSSGAFCTVGGMASTNASGAHSLGFGSTRPWVQALDCVFDDGSRAEVRRGSPPPSIPAVDRFLRDVHPSIIADAAVDHTWHAGVRKDSSGYAVKAYTDGGGELVDLLVGSEGTLVIFVGVELALAPAAETTSSVLGAFPDLGRAVVAAVSARESGAVSCELLDRTFLDVVAAGGRPMGVPRGTEAVLLAEVESQDSAGATQAAQRLGADFRRAGATAVRLALDSATETELWELRHAASPMLSRLDPALKSMQFIEDGAVPPDRLAAYVLGVRHSLDTNGVRGVIFGHAGDANVHVNPLIDVRLPDWRARVERVLAEVTGLVASLGGTVTGEHGDGRLRTPLLHQVWPAAARERFSMIKRAFDPASILNPGVKVPVAHQQPLGDIKYDPALPPLPAAAGRALAAVERDRLYSTFRLDLLTR